MTQFNYNNFKTITIKFNRKPPPWWENCGGLCQPLQLNRPIKNGIAKENANTSKSENQIDVFLCLKQKSISKSPFIASIQQLCHSPRNITHRTKEKSCFHFDSFKVQIHRKFKYSMANGHEHGLDNADRHIGPGGRRNKETKGEVVSLYGMLK